MERQKMAWKRQRLLKQKYSYDEVPDLGELTDLVESIIIEGKYGEFYTDRARALFVMYYLTACRLKELLAFKKVINIRNKQGEILSQEVIKKRKGIRKKDIKIVEEKEGLCMYVRTGNMKNRMKHTKKQPIPLELEKDLVKYLKKYLSWLEPDEELFKFKNKRATQIINETTGWNIHFIRHVRATHLVVKYDFNDQLLVKYMGWSNSLPAKHYMELSSKDMFRQFYRGRGNGN